MEALIVDHLSLVPLAAGYVLRRRRLPSHVERGDLEAAGRFALVTVALRFRADGGASFKTYALRRIVGSMIDHLRDSAPLSRHAWKKYLAGDDSVKRTFVDLASHPELEAEISMPAHQEQDLAAAGLVDNFEDTLRLALRALPAREEKVLLLYYRDNLTMRAISDRIGVNESRVSQLHARALRRLRRAMGVELHG